MNRAESETQTPPVVGDGQVEIIPMIPCGEDDVLPLDSDLAARSEASATASQRSFASASRLHRQTFEGVNVPGTVPAINHMSTANLEHFTHIADSPLISPHMQGLRNPPTFRFASARLPDQSYSPNESLIQFDNLVAKFLTATGKFEDDDGYDLRPATRREDDVIRATVGIPKVAPGSPLSRSGATSMRSVRVRPETKAPSAAKTRTMEVRWLDG